MKVVLLLCAIAATVSAGPHRVRLSPSEGMMNPYVTKPCGAVVEQRVIERVLAMPMIDVDTTTLTLVDGNKPAEIYAGTDNPITGYWKLGNGGLLGISISRAVRHATTGTKPDKSYKLVAMSLSIVMPNGCYEQWVGGGVVQE